MNKNLIVQAIELITFLFAAFGQFLLNIAPPAESNASFSIGISSFLLLGILLLISALTKKHPSERTKSIWIAISVFLLISGAVCGFIYKLNMDKYTITIPLENDNYVLIIGNQLTPDARTFANKSNISNKELLMNFGIENIDEVWTSESRRKVGFMLSLNYTIFVLSICSAIFCIIEGLATKNEEEIPK